MTGHSYFSFLMTVILGMGLMFELPIFILVLSQIGLVTPRFLLRNFRWAVLIIFVVSGHHHPDRRTRSTCSSSPCRR